MEGFKLFDNYYGLIADDNDGTKVYGWENLSQKRNNVIENLSLLGGVYGYVDMGEITIQDFAGDNSMVVKSGEWFTTRAGAKIQINNKGSYRIAAWQKDNYIGTLSKGLVDSYGRLKYIDGCTDNVLSSPIKKGLPCMNALYMPEGVNQTMHTHPSTRSGFIFIGGASCETPSNTFDLKTGQIFFLEKGTKHKFRSDHNKNIILKLVAYHPDSDFGATDEDNPMLNKTIVNGISASKLDDIRTK